MGPAAAPSYRRVLLALFAALALLSASWAGCVSTTVAETPEQRYYAAKGEYVVVLQLAVAYANSPSADKDVVQRMAAIDREVTRVIRKADAALMDADREVKRGECERWARLIRTLTAELRRIYDTVPERPEEPA